MAEQEDDNLIDDRILLDPDALGSGSGDGSSSGDSSANNQGTHEDPLEDEYPDEPIDDGPMIPINEDIEEPAGDPIPVEPEPEDPGDEPREDNSGIKKQKITVTGIEDGVSWQAIPNQTWLKVTEIVSGAAEDSFYVSVDANNAGESRTGIVTVIPSDNGANGTVNVYQQGAVLYTLSISPTTITHGYSSEEIAIIIISNTSWTISGPSWVNLDRTSGTGDAMVVGELSENTDTNSRSGTITVSTAHGGPTATCAVMQYAEAAEEQLTVNVPNQSNRAYYVLLFAEGEEPNEMFSVTQYIFYISDLDMTMSETFPIDEVPVNLRSGANTFARTGDRVSIYTCTTGEILYNSLASFAVSEGTFTFPIT